MSREKGKRGERELAALLRAHGYDAARTAQHKGKTGKAADVEGLPGIHIECKRVERFDLYGALSQAISECGENIPTVMHRRNDCPWVVVLRLEDFMQIYIEWEAGQPQAVQP